VTATPRRGTGPSAGGPAAPLALVPVTGPPAGVPAGFEAARAVADAVLYEGYLLYPYRRSAAKNRFRWQFGVLAPRPFIEAAGPADTGLAGAADAWQQQTELLLEAREDAELFVRLRFLQVQRRSVERRTGGGWEAVDALEVDGERHFGFDEALPREFDLAVPLRDLRDRPSLARVTAPAGAQVERLRDVGRIVRESRPVEAALRLELYAAEAPFRLHRLRLVVENAAGTGAELTRPEALRVSLVAAHTLLGVRGGRFLSLLDPPLWAAPAAQACRNVHTFPVLAGPAGGRDVVLSSPIILYDHPEIAPESPGPLFDSGEIDEILSLRTRTLTDEEKREARATDPQAAALLDRVDSLPDEMLARLHGAVRSLRPVRGRDDGSLPDEHDAEQPWWQPGADAHIDPDRDAVVLQGVPVARGSRVRLHPRAHGTDAHDAFLDGRSARVHGVFLDVDGVRHVAVTLEDDPGAELHEWYRRFWYFAPEELSPLPEDGAR
jgi:hypothetical protein